MPMPFLRRFFPTMPPEGQAERLLENEYQIERIAWEDSESASLSEYLASLQGTYRTLALSRLQTLAATEKKGGSFAALCSLLGATQPMGTDRFPIVDMVAQDAVATAKRLRERGAALHAVLASQLPAGAGDGTEVQVEAIRALKNGMTASGRDQQEEFKDALRLFREAQEGAIGNRNYAVWFQIGWILWKSGDFAAAEEAFYQAYRLSASAVDTFHYLSLRHRAYLQYLQDKAGEARDTITRAIALFPDDPDTLLDAARYAAATGDADETVALVTRLIEVEPSQALMLFADSDFTAVASVIADAVLTRAQTGTRQAADSIARLTAAEANVRAAQERTGITIALDDALTTGVADAADILRRHAGSLTHPTTVSITRTATAKTHDIYASAYAALEAAATALEQRVVRPQRQIERLQNEHARWKEEISRAERTARQMNFFLGAPPKRNLFGRVNPAHATLYDNYQHARSQDEMTQKAIETEVPGYQEEIARGEAERQKIADTIAWLKAEEAGAG